MVDALIAADPRDSGRRFLANVGFVVRRLE
jgi:hypothetical protein